MGVILLLPLLYLGLAGLSILALLNLAGSVVTLLMYRDRVAVFAVARAALLVGVPVGLWLVTQGVGMNADIALAGAPPSPEEKALGLRLISVGAVLAVSCGAVLVILDRGRRQGKPAGPGGGLE
jgi:hypothetical protein